MNSLDSVIITEKTVDKLRELIADEGNQELFVKVELDAEKQINFTFKENKSDDDHAIEKNGVRIDFTPDAFEALRGASIDFNDDSFVVKYRNITPNVTEWSQLNYLPPIPDISQLPSLRKGLRKQKIPDISVLTEFSYDNIGNFSIQHSLEDSCISWNIAEKLTKIFNFNDLCFNVERELDRLEFGWMIANIARQDMFNQMEEANNIPHPLYAEEAINKAINHYEKIEKKWRHWSLVPAGHMLT